MRIAIAGGTGFIGRALTQSLLDSGHEVTVLTRRPRAAESLPRGARGVVWDARDPTGEWSSALRGSDAIVNLAGASIGGGRWTSARKQLLSVSRIAPTEALVRAIAALPAAERPRSLINASGIDYYGDRPGEEPLDEQAPPGDSFLARLCVRWEAAAQTAEPLGVRVVRVRTAFCVGRNAPSLRLMVLPFRLFAGGPLGTGRQWFTWIHLADLVALYTLALERAELSGALNAVAPRVPREREVAADIGRVLRRPAVVPAPGFMLRLVLGEMGDLLLHGRKAVPAKAQAAGYQFRYVDIGAALREALTEA